jgi:hypothetical protein
MLKLKLVVSCLCFALLIILSGCGAAKFKDVVIKEPALNIKRFFDGNLTASGVLKNRSGQVIRTFTASIKAYWEEGVGTLEEDFIFNDGEKQRRVWVLKSQNDGSYIATAGDVSGEGKAVIVGNQMNFDYVLQVSYKGSIVEVRVDDRMYLVNDGLLLNESRMTKFGFTVGYILLSINRED